MFCINHGKCDKNGDNGSCTVYSVTGVASVNRGRGCGFLAIEKKKTPIIKTRTGQQKQKQKKEKI